MTTALAVDGVRRDLKGRRVLNGLDLSLDAGECRAIVGLNGAGKTTALRVMLGMLRPDAGTVTILGTRLPSADRSVWRSVGHLVETPFSYPELTARQNIEASAALHGVSSAPASTRIAEFADRLMLTPWLDTPVRRLSRGTRQKVGLAAAFVHEPRLIVLDEPTNGLDPLAVVALRNLIADATRAGAAVIVTSHHFDELARLADRVDVLHHERIIDTLTPNGPDLEQRFFNTVLAADTAAVSA